MNRKEIRDAISRIQRRKREEEDIKMREKRILLFNHSNSREIADLEPPQKTKKSVKVLQEKRVVQKSKKIDVDQCRRRGADDLISELPDDIVVRILSFLSFKEAAGTSVLSKWWLPLWTYIPRLDFDDTKRLAKIRMNQNLHKKMMNKFVRWVNRTLLHMYCKDQRLDRFRVCFDLDKFAQHDIDKWLEFAFARQVQRLELDLSICGNSLRYFDDCYAFPEQLLDNVCQPQRPPLCHNFKSVKVLIFKSVNVTGQVLEFFLYNCPFLEEMVVRGSGTLVNLKVVGPSLKLELLEILFCLNLKSLQICDTNLVTLRTSSGHKLLLRNAPMLIEVQIWGLMCCPDVLDGILPWVSCVLSQLEVLEVYVNEGWEYLEHYKFPQLTKLKKFVVTVHVWEDMSVLGCTYAMRAAPHLEEFELKLYWLKPKRSNRECRMALRCPHHHLKVLRLCGYYGRTSDVELVRYFLENAIALEKVIVDPQPPYAFSRVPLSLDQIQEEQMARNLAKVQLQSEVPPHIELVIL